MYRNYAREKPRAPRNKEQNHHQHTFHRGRMPSIAMLFHHFAAHCCSVGLLQRFEHLCKLGQIGTMRGGRSRPKCPHPRFALTLVVTCTQCAQHGQTLASARITSNTCTRSVRRRVVSARRAAMTRNRHALIGHGRASAQRIRIFSRSAPWRAACARTCVSTSATTVLSGLQLARCEGLRVCARACWLSVP